MTLKELYDEVSGKVIDRLAEDVGVSRATIRAWVKGYRYSETSKPRRPTMEQIYKLADAHKSLKVNDLVQEFYPREG